MKTQIEQHVKSKGPAFDMNYFYLLGISLSMRFGVHIELGGGERVGVPLQGRLGGDK